MPRLQRIAGPVPGVAAFERRLGAEQIAYKATRFIEWSLPERGRPASRGRSAGRARGLRRRGRGGGACAAAPGPPRPPELERPRARARGRRALACCCSTSRAPGSRRPSTTWSACCATPTSSCPSARSKQHLERVRPELPDAPAPEDFRRALRSADARAQGQGPRALPLRRAHARRRALSALRAGDGPPPARAPPGARRRATRVSRRWPSWSPSCRRRRARDDRGRRARHPAAPAHRPAPEAGAARARASARRLSPRAAGAPWRQRGGDQRPPPARSS